MKRQQTGITLREGGARGKPNGLVGGVEAVLVRGVGDRESGVCQVDTVDAAAGGGEWHSVLAKLELPHRLRSDRSARIGRSGVEDSVFTVKFREY